jgi:hypothetical protein
MAKDTSVKAELTQSKIDQMRFEKRVVGVNDNGSLCFMETNSGDEQPVVKDWMLRDSKLLGFMVRVYPSKSVYMVQRKMSLREGPMGILKSAPVRRIIGSTSDIKLEEARKTAQLWLGWMATTRPGKRISCREKHFRGVLLGLRCFGGRAQEVSH